MNLPHWSRVTVHGRLRNPSRRCAIERRCRLGLCQPQQSLWYNWSRPHTGSMCRDSICRFMECVKYFKIYIVLKKIDNKKRHDKTISLSLTLYVNVLPGQRDSAEVNHMANDPKQCLWTNLAWGLLCVWDCGTRTNTKTSGPHRPYPSPPWVLTIKKYCQGADSSARDWPLVCPCTQFLQVRLRFTVHTLSFTPRTSEPCAGVFQWAHITASQEIERAHYVYVYHIYIYVVRAFGVYFVPKHKWSKNLDLFQKHGS